MTCTTLLVIGSLVIAPCNLVYMDLTPSENGEKCRLGLFMKEYRAVEYVKFTCEEVREYILHRTNRS